MNPRKLLAGILLLITPTSLPAGVKVTINTEPDPDAHYEGILEIQSFSLEESEEETKIQLVYKSTYRKAKVWINAMRKGDKYNASAQAKIRKYPFGQKLTYSLVINKKRKRLIEDAVYRFLDTDAQLQGTSNKEFFEWLLASFHEAESRKLTPTWRNGLPPEGPPPQSEEH